MKTFLHVGCGPKRKDRTTKALQAALPTPLEPAQMSETLQFN